MYKRFFKRLFDIIFSGLGMICLCIPMLIIAIIIKCEDKGPAMFKQQRVGKNKELFWLYKFRTMKTDTPHDIPTHLLESPEKYILKIGRLLRITSVDELPQLLNIFKGDMSIVGPRPALYNQDDLIEERDKYGANDCRPGLTGWAQINGRDELEISEKAAFDGEYVQKMSFGFDLKCFFGSIISVLKRKGVKEGGTGRMKKEAEQKKRQKEEEKEQEKQTVNE